MIDFLLAHWEFLTFCFLAFIEILIFIIKKPVKVDSIKVKIAQVLPLYIEYAERYFQRFPKSGLDKLNFVLNSVKDLLRIKDSNYDSYIVENVERILSTPTKKENFDEK